MEKTMARREEYDQLSYKSCQVVSKIKFATYFLGEDEDFRESCPDYGSGVVAMLDEAQDTIERMRQLLDEYHHILLYGKEAAEDKKAAEAVGL